MDNSKGFIPRRDTHLQQATAAVGSHKHQEIVSAEDADRIPTCVTGIIFADPMSPSAVGELQAREIKIH